MVTNSPYGIDHVTRPGYGEPEPLEPVPTRDPPHAVNRCLDCPVPDRECTGNCKPGQDGPQNTRSEKVRVRDGKIRDLINAGWRNNDAICEELGISRDMLTTAKRRLRERGEIK